MELMEHQRKAVDDLSNGKILVGGVGTGKSFTAATYYMEKEAPKDIYVITTAKKRDTLDWEVDFSKFGISVDREFTKPGTGVLTVDSWQNIEKYADVEDAFFIFDEQRVVGHGKWVKNFIKLARKNRWILLSATPGDTWLDFIPVFIANGLYRNITQFKAEHVVYAPYSKYPRIIRYTNVGLLEKYRNMLLVEMPYHRHTNRILREIVCSHDREAMKQVVVRRWNIFDNKPLKDVGDLFRVMRKVVNGDPSRLQHLRQLMDVHPRIIVFYNFDYELEALRRLIHDEVAIGEWNGHRKNPIPDTERWVYLVQYVAGAEGWNCISTDTVVFYSLTYSYKNFEQAQGRIDRLNTPFVDLYYYVFTSNSAIDQAVRRSIGSKKLFNERSWAAEHHLTF